MRKPPSSGRDISSGAAFSLQSHSTKNVVSITVPRPHVATAPVYSSDSWPSGKG